MSVEDLGRPIGEEERADAVARLRRAAADGVLDAAELERRVGLALRARRLGELRSAVLGTRPEYGGSTFASWPSLVGGPEPAPPAPVAPSPPPDPVLHGYVPEDRMVFVADASSVRRRGPWVVPPYLRVRAGLAAVQLDCREARPASSLIDVEIEPGASSVIFIVPRGWAAVTDRLRGVRPLASMSVRVPRTPYSGCPSLVLHGRLGVSALIVREASWLERRRESR